MKEEVYVGLSISALWFILQEHKIFIFLYDI